MTVLLACAAIIDDCFSMFDSSLRITARFVDLKRDDVSDGPRSYPL